MIAHFGTFDVANYGDLLFPLVLERRLSTAARRFLHASPVGGRAPMGLAAESVAVQALPDTLTGVVVGGGHLIHASPSNVDTYRATATTALQAYPSLWLGAAHHALRTKAPLVWNAPGLPSALSPEAAPALAWATSFCDYLALRDERSLRLLVEAGFEGEAQVVPDTGFDVVRLFSSRELEAAYRAVFRDRRRDRDRDTIAIHANARYLGEEPGLVAARIERLCARENLEPILLGIGGCHGDAELARTLAQSMRGDPIVVDEPKSLLEVAACIAHSRCYLGSSLHGSITACAFGIPNLIVAKEGPDAGKFSGFLSPLDLQAWLLPDWAEAEARAPELLRADPTPWRAVPDRVGPALDRHWNRLAAALDGPPRAAALSEQATAAFEAMQRKALESAGIYAALLPHQAALAVSQQTALAKQRRHAADLKASYRGAARELRRRIEFLEKQIEAPDETGAR